MDVKFGLQYSSRQSERSLKLRLPEPNRKERFSLSRRLRAGAWDIENTGEQGVRQRAARERVEYRKSLMSDH